MIRQGKPKAAFPVLYNIASMKDAPMATNMDYSSGTLQWNINFVCLVHDWEVDILASFYSLLYSFRERTGEEDKLWWSRLTKGSLMLDLFTRS